MTEGTKGGDVNRPASVPETPKLARNTCEKCGMTGPRPLVVWAGDCWRCSNVPACDWRDQRGIAAMARRMAKEAKR